MNTPAPALISVILPTHNRAALLPRAIRSVLAQSHRELELIVVDDCSSDDTPQVVAAIADPRLRYLRLTHSHHAAGARNAGIAAARGEFIAFQDDDDLWFVEKLEKQLATLRAGGDAVGLNLCGRIRFDRKAPSYVGGEQTLQRMQFTRGPLEGFAMLATPAWLVRKRYLDQTSGFDEQLHTWEDWELALRLSKICRINQIDEPLYLQDRDVGGALWKDHRLFSAAMQRILAVHAELWQTQPQRLAKLHFLIGRYETIHGSAAVARRWLRSAVRLHAFYPKAWVAYLLSYLGRAPMRGAAALAQIVRQRRTRSAR
jgi:glycosyltransferase involved in cell wall biosynthesis